MMRSVVRSVVLVCVSTFGVAGMASAGPITFASAADYDNNAAQTTGWFRDVLNGSLINRGLDVGGTGHTALNFTGSDNNAAVLGRIAVYDTAPSTTSPTFFTGDIAISADILIGTVNNGKGAGIMTLFGESGSDAGLALFLSDAGNSDGLNVRLVQQTGISSANLSTVALGTGITEDAWYRLALTLSFNGPNFTITGKVYGHTTDTDPNSALGAQVGSTLSYTALLSSGNYSNPYEIGLVGRGIGAVEDTSVTNFDIEGGAIVNNTDVTAVPEPGTIALIGTGLVAVAARLRRRR